jgi:hypothetical protein
MLQMYGFLRKRWSGNLVVGGWVIFQKIYLTPELPDNSNRLPDPLATDYYFMQDFCLF